MEHTVLSWLKAVIAGLAMLGMAMIIQAQQVAQADETAVAIVVCADQEDPEALLVEEVSPPDAVENGEGADCGTTINELLESGYSIRAVNSATGGVSGGDPVVHVIYTLKQSTPGDD
jgi:hypothetical protein